jgi:thermostable 8-oxoguanine DNA glycosylase
MRSQKDALLDVTKHEDLAGIQPILDEDARVALMIGGRKLAIRWGKTDHLGSCAYWTTQAAAFGPSPSLAQTETLAQEVVFCLLGGYGITYAVNDAAYRALSVAGLTQGTPNASDIEAVLREPLTLAQGERRRYRFPAQRAARVATALRMLDGTSEPRDALKLRDWLCGLPGVGLKTASWIVRNRHGDDRIAVIDVHVRRAGLAAGFFAPEWTLPRDYRSFELAFCAVARLGGVSAAALDAVMWQQLQALGRARHLLIGATTA